MRRVASSILSIVGVIGLFSFLSFRGQSELGHRVFQMGEPDTWLYWEESLGHTNLEMKIFRWSVAMGIASIFAIHYAVVLWRPQKVKPAGTSG